MYQLLSAKKVVNSTCFYPKFVLSLVNAHFVNNLKCYELFIFFTTLHLNDQIKI